jgi:hypothetical protein
MKDGSGAMHAEGTIPATRFDLDRWINTLPQPWSAAREATMFAAGSTIISNHMLLP